MSCWLGSELFRLSDFDILSSFGLRHLSLNYMVDDLTELNQQVILDHSRSPLNFHKLENASHSAHGHNPLCGDDYTIYTLMDGDRIKDISFQGAGCAISKASASILTDTLKGKTRAEVKALFDKVHDMVTSGNSDD